VQIHFCETGFDEVRNVVLRHAFLEGSEGGAEDVEGGFASEAHELELVHGFVSPAGDGDGISGGILEAGRGVAQMIEKVKPAVSSMPMRPVRMLWSASAAAAIFVGL